MGEQNAARLEGDRYQHLYSWYELLPLLDENPPYEYAFVEHPHAKSADDITLHAKKTTGIASKFIQVKWHVDQRSTYSFDSLMVIRPGSRSLIKKLFDSWVVLSAGSIPVEIWLVSNWSIAPELGKFLKGLGHTLSDDFFKPTLNKHNIQSREKWKQHLGVDDNQLNAFCRDLRLRLGFGSITDVEAMVDDRMRGYGLQTGTDARAKAIDEISKWIELGGENKKINREVLLEAIQRRDLRYILPDEPSVSLWIHAWEKQVFDVHSPTIEIDWTQHFDRPKRSIPAQLTWEEVIFPSLISAGKKLRKHPNSSYIDFRGKLPLTATLAVGAAFPQVGGYRFRIEQPTQDGKFLWISNAKASKRHFKVVKEDGQNGKDLLIALCISGPAWQEVEKLYSEAAGAFTAVVYAEPDNGPGKAALNSDSDATALANHAIELIRNYRRKYCASRIHMVLFCPAAFSLFLGQRLNALGTIINYERTVDGGYQRSVTLHTG